MERIVFRTGIPRTFPTVDTPADQTYDLPDAGAQDPLAEYGIANVKTSSADKDASSALLKYADFSHYADCFNGMEDENVVQAIPNAKASEWMEENIPSVSYTHLDVYKRQTPCRTYSYCGNAG